MAGKKPTMRENISSRPTDSSGRRATNADLGIGPGVAALRKAAAEKITAQEGTTSSSGGRPAKAAMPKAAEAALLRAGSIKPKMVKPVYNPAKPAAMVKPIYNPAKPAVRQQAVIRTTTTMKPTPSAKKR